MTINTKKNSLMVTPNIEDTDTFYAELINMQAGMTDAAAQSAISKLLLVLANHVGDIDVLLEAIELVKKDSIDNGNN